MQSTPLTFNIEYKGTTHNITLYDTIGSDTLRFVIPQILEDDEYGLKTISFSPDDVVVDVGANIGTVSIILAKLNPYIKIYAFEPCDINYQNLIRNLEINNINNVMPFKLGVGGESGREFTITFDASCSGSSGAFRIYADPTDLANQFKTISFDDLVTTNNIKKIRLLKIDCEGGEFAFLEASKLFPTFPIDYLSMEIHLYMNRYGRSKQELYRLLNAKKLERLITHEV